MRCQCIICTDNFDANGAIASVPCGHTFHESCLLRWLKTTPSCPSCRVNAKPREVRKIYLMSFNDSILDAGEMENQLSATMARVHQLRQELSTVTESQDAMKKLFVAKEKELEKCKQKYHKSVEEVNTLKAKAKSIKLTLQENEQLHKTLAELKGTMQKMNHLESVLHGTTRDVEELLKTYGPGENAVRQIATYCVLLKRELNSAKTDLRSARNDVSQMTRKLLLTQAKLADTTQNLEKSLAEAATLKENYAKLANQVENLGAERSGQTSDKRRITQSGEVAGATENSCKKARLDASLNTTVVPSPPVLKRAYLADTARTDPKQIFKALPGYASMKIVSGVRRSEQKVLSEVDKERMSKLVKMRRQNSATGSGEDTTSKIRTGYNGLGGHSSHIRTERDLR